MSEDLASLAPADVVEMSDDRIRDVLESLLAVQQADRQENQLLFYKPVSEHAERIHKSKAKFLGVGGGNGSGKTETNLVDMIALATGIIPESIPYIRERFRGPIKCRVVLESLKTVLHPTFLPKMQWWKWSGVDEQGGDRGHWGWVPRYCLRDGSWDKSWSEKLCMLTVLCRNPDNSDEVIGESSFQFMSHDQDSSDFASGDYHDILHDEPPKYATWRENAARTMRVAGRMRLAMTWPDDPSIPVDWVFDEMYEKGRGPQKSPDHDWFDIYTTDNPNLDQDAVAVQMANWTDETKKVRIFGQPIRFGNRIHPLFSDHTQEWCYSCGRLEMSKDGACTSCGSKNVGTFNHVKEFDVGQWPCVFVLDPHPRKPHMFAWIAVDPSDDLWVVAEGQVDGDPTDVRVAVENMEENLGLRTALRLMDPNMGRSPSSSKRGIVWQDDFESAGLRCDLADDGDVGRGRINQFLKPDQHRLQPRLHIHSRCAQTIFQMKRYVWDEHRQRYEKDLKQTPKTKNDDYPTMLKYCANYEPTFRFLSAGAPILNWAGGRRR